ncbi:hypothetical protein CIHG_03576 [Coccidioides immitis H538.4]|uniref:Vezatin n=1 Tax=Coccidioides immitis H538.4 TaxID=396776 RepID=A0A0J8RLM9_COCIT|nr:hypothetical protein CIHG_03576 [Coccidioides immitis H538.4]
MASKEYSIALDRLSRGSGEARSDWDPQDITSPSQEPLDTSPRNFAPTGGTKLQDRIRSKLPAPLRLKHSNKREALARVQEACVAALSAGIGKSDNERFLEQFGYIVVASQLLNEPTPPSYSSITGAVTQSAKSTEGQPTSQPVVFDLYAVAVSFYIFARRQWLKYIRHEALNVATVLVGNSQNFDSVVAASVLLIQEVELVSRGYRLSTPMPPVTRLEDQTQARRCLKLRRVLSKYMSELLGQYLVAKKKLRLYADDTNLGKYYDIYDFSPEELDEAELSLTDSSPEDKASLRSLRILFTRLYALTPATRERHRAQFRRLKSLSQGIRSLHAKMHLIREESNACLEKSGEDSELNTTLISQYESIGADLRGLLQEWEAGKSTLLANIERPERLSRPIEFIEISCVPPPSVLGGATAVDGSPAAALRALNGEDLSLPSPDHNMDDEEVFEAVALPRKRSSMTREERIARVKEDRAKQAAARDRADANTRMLRELETVIKLRPRGRDIEKEAAQSWTLSHPYHRTILPTLGFEQLNGLSNANAPTKRAAYLSLPARTISHPGVHLSYFPRLLSLYSLHPS